MVEIFTTQTCPRCHMLKEKMNIKGIDFKENQDVDEVIKLGYRSVPIVKKEDGEILDFGKAISWINSL